MRELGHGGVPVLLGLPGGEMSRTERVCKARGKHSSHARALSGRMVTVGGCTLRDESEMTTRFPRETCHGYGVSSREFEALVGRRPCDMR